MIKLTSVAQASAILEMASAFGILDEPGELIGSMLAEGRSVDNLTKFLDAVMELVEASNQILPPHQQVHIGDLKRYIE